MADLMIRRDHGLGLAAARQVCDRWLQQAREQYHLQCALERSPDSGADAGAEGTAGCDVVRFSGAGVSGELRVTGESFELQANLSFLMRGFKVRIEQEINRNLDLLLAGPGGSREH